MTRKFAHYYFVLSPSKFSNLTHPIFRVQKWRTHVLRKFYRDVPILVHVIVRFTIVSGKVDEIKENLATSLTTLTVTNGEPILLSGYGIIHDKELLNPHEFIRPYA